MNGIYNLNIIVIFIAIAILLTTNVGCSSREVNRDIYNALMQREGIKKTGEPNCDSGQPSYEDYQREMETTNSRE